MRMPPFVSPAGLIAPALFAQTTAAQTPHRPASAVNSNCPSRWRSAGECVGVML